MESYIVATIKDWNIKAFQKRYSVLPGVWYLIEQKEKLTKEYVDQINPRYIFFPHWSWIVPQEILQDYECVCFHMTDLPYGRGGSPLQNLIVRGNKSTKLTALKMTAEIDAGPVYLKKPLDLSGSAQEIFIRVADLVYDMIEEIVDRAPEPLPQEGEPVYFSRRTPDMSEVTADLDILGLYDHIRMLDADSYPRAFTRIGDMRFSFTNARISEEGELVAEVRVKQEKRGNSN